MSLKKSVLSALVILSSLSSLAAQADLDRHDRRGDRRDPWCDTRRDPFCDRRDNDRDDRRDRLDLIVEQDVRRYFDQRSSLDLLLDSYTRSQLLGRRVRDIRISMATEQGRGQASLLINSRQLEPSVIVARDVRDYSFRIDPFTNEVGRSVRSLSLEMQGRFYVDRVVFVLEEDRGSIDPFPGPSRTEVVRQQINQTFDREGGINLFRQLPLLERQGRIVKRVNVVAMAQRGAGVISLLQNSQSYGQSQGVGFSPTRLTFELDGRGRIGLELQSLRLQINGSVTVLEVSVELEETLGNDGPWGNRPGDIISPLPGDMGGPGRDIIRPR